MSCKSPLNLPAIISEVNFHFSVMGNVLRKLLGKNILSNYSDKRGTLIFFSL